MFEIPDDDDLFSEENLKGLLPDASTDSAGQQQQREVKATGSSHVLRPSGLGQGAAVASSMAEGEGEDQGSPRTKRMRVLADVNWPPPRSDPAVQKSMREESRARERTADVFGSPLSCHSASLKDGADSGLTPLPRRRSLRKFPGPAGILPPANPSDLTSLMRKNAGGSPQIVSEVSSSKPEEEVMSTQSGGEVFGGTAWRSLVADLEPGADSVLTKFSVRAMLHKASRRLLPKGKVPLMMGVLDSIDLQGSDASVMLRDPTGGMSGTLHREAVKDFSSELTAGAALVLRQVSVISPSSRTHYLNITGGNIVAIYPAQDHTAPTLLPPSPHLGAPVSCGQLMKSCVTAAEIELLEAANAAKESALCRLRQRACPVPACGSPGVGGVRAGLFSSTPYQGGRGAAGGPFTPHRPRQTPPPSLSPACVMGRFNFTNKTTSASLSPPMRQPAPVSGENSACGVSNGGSSLQRGTAVYRSGFARDPTRDSSRDSTRDPTRDSTPCTPLKNGSAGGGGNSGHAESASCRLQPPAPGSVNMVFVTRQGSDRRQGCETGDSRAVGQWGTVSTTPCGPGRSAVTPSHRTTPTPSAATHHADRNHPPPQHSKWSFKSRTCLPSSSQQPSEGGVGTGRPSQQPAGAVSGSSLHSAGPPETSTKGDGVSWEDELDDDLLSQLSDDF